MIARQVETPARDHTSMVANFNGKCQDRCGLAIHAGHDHIERGHFGWRHVDCEQASVRAQVRDKLMEGWSIDEVWAWLERSEHVDLNARIDAIFYAKGMIGAALNEKRRCPRCDVVVAQNARGDICPSNQYDCPLERPENEERP